MAKSVGIRMDEDLLKKLDRISEEENLDRSTLVRKLLGKGYESFLKERAAEKYKRGEITLSKAAEEANITLWEMEEFLIKSGYISKYSIKDLKQEITNL